MEKEQKIIEQLRQQLTDDSHIDELKSILAEADRLKAVATDLAMRAEKDAREGGLLMDTIRDLQSKLSLCVEGLKEIHNLSWSEGMQMSAIAGNLLTKLRGEK